VYLYEKCVSLYISNVFLALLVIADKSLFSMKFSFFSNAGLSIIPVETAGS